VARSQRTDYQEAQRERAVNDCEPVTIPNAELIQKIESDHAGVGKRAGHAVGADIKEVRQRLVLLKGENARWSLIAGTADPVFGDESAVIDVDTDVRIEARIRRAAQYDCGNGKEAGDSAVHFSFSCKAVFRRSWMRSPSRIMDIHPMR
jgi:hypothetical protein